MATVRLGGAYESGTTVITLFLAACLLDGYELLTITTTIFRSRVLLLHIALLLRRDPFFFLAIFIVISFLDDVAVEFQCWSRVLCLCRSWQIVFASSCLVTCAFSVLLEYQGSDACFFSGISIILGEMRGWGEALYCLAREKW